MPDPRARTLLPLAPLLLAFAGCAGGSLATRGAVNDEAGLVYAPEDPFAHGDDDSEPADDDDQAGGWVEVVSYDPPAGADDHHYRAPIRVQFSDVALSAWVGLFDVETGYQLPVLQEWSEGGTVLTATPVAWLEPLKEYGVAIDLGDASLEYRFSTSEIGTPVGPESDPGGASTLLDGRLYEIEFGAARSEDGSGLGEMLRLLDGGPAWVWQVDFGEGSYELDLNTGIADVDADGNAEAQDLCTATQVLGTSGSPVLLSDPYFASAAGPLDLTVDGTVLSFEDAWVDGDFTPDGTGLVEIGFRGWLRADSTAGLLDTDSCGWLEDQLGTACQPCPSGAGQCAWVEVAGLRGTQTPIDFGWVDADDVGECPDPLDVLGCSFEGSPARAPVLALLLAAAILAARRRA